MSDPDSPRLAVRSGKRRARSWARPPITRLPDHPVTVNPPIREAGLVPGVHVERPTGRTTWAPGARSARLARVDGVGMIRPSIPEPERRRRRPFGRRWVMRHTTRVFLVFSVLVCLTDQAAWSAAVSSVPPRFPRGRAALPPVAWTRYLSPAWGAGGGLPDPGREQEHRDCERQHEQHHNGADRAH